MADELKVTKKQHYLPKAYLQFFAQQERKKKKIYAYFISEKTVRYIPIDDICQKQYLYEQWFTFPGDSNIYMYAPNEIENSFIEEEGQYAAITKRIIDETCSSDIVILTAEERRKLAQFMSRIVHRSPEMIHIMNFFAQDEYSKHPSIFAKVKSQNPNIPESFFTAAYAHELIRTSNMWHYRTRSTDSLQNRIFSFCYK